jgi:hypothetical protein
MARVGTDGDGSATIILSDGLSVRLPGLKNAPDVDAQDLRNIATALFALVERLDNRIEALEKRMTAER